MDSQAIGVIIGGAIGIVSGVFTQVVSHHFTKKRELEKRAYEERLRSELKNHDELQKQKEKENKDIIASLERLAKPLDRNELIFDPTTGEFVYGESLVVENIAHDGFACFLGHTKIIMSDKSRKEISTIAAGDEVLMLENYDEVAFTARVKAIKKATSTNYILVNNILKTTESEKVLTRKGLKAVSELTINDYVYSADFEFKPITSIETKIFEVTVYNLVFDEDGYFFADEILVGDYYSKNQG